MRRVALIALVVAGTVAMVRPALAEPTVCMSGRDGCAIRPHVLPYGAHAAIRHIRWHYWGHSRAIGYGSLKYGATVTEPAYGPYAAKIILGEIAECKGRLWYSRQTIKIGRHYGKVLENNEPVGPCYYP